MSDLADALSRDDDTDRLRTMMREKPSDPALEIKTLAIAFDRHEREDRRAIRVALVLLGVIATAAIGMGGLYLSDREEAARTAARIDEMSRDVARIEDQIDRLDDRMRGGDRP